MRQVLPASSSSSDCLMRVLRAGKVTLELDIGRRSSPTPAIAWRNQSNKNPRQGWIDCHQALFLPLKIYPIHFWRSSLSISRLLGNLCTYV
ncbi:MAG: hypothetical protein NTX04_12100 [Verrucomicrobia bacterium]|nr:hypothetical protein [Verrucomicrobiota bacterium]